jgi:hypothetical protein
MCPATHYIFIVHIIIIMLKNGCNKEEFFLEEEVVAKMKKWYQFLIFFFTHSLVAEVMAGTYGNPNLARSFIKLGAQGSSV